MWISLSVLIATVIFLCIIIVKKNQNYFRRRKIPYLKSPPLLGAYADVFLGKDSIFEKVLEIYNHEDLKDEKYFGMFIFHKPALFVKDPAIIKQVLITDFNSFNNRYASASPHDPLGHYQLFLANNPSWKTIRTKLSPFFSSAKLKAAYYLIENLGNDLNKMVQQQFTSESDQVELNLKRVTDLFFIDVIASVAFGLDVKTMENPSNDFYKAASSFFRYTPWRGFELTANVLLPQIVKFCRFKNMSYDLDRYIYEVMPRVFEDRLKSGVRRNDLIDTLLDIKDELVPEYKEHTVQDMMFGQIGIFLAAGYETSSSTTSFTLYELSKQPQLQKRLRSEIRDALHKTDGKVTYEMAASASEMPLLHRSVLETLRHYAVAPTLDRICTSTKSVTINDGSFEIPGGMPIVIPLYALCKDPKYFEDPLAYNPDRFASDNVYDIPAFISNLAFGAGPRYCIGERLGLIQTKVALLMLLKEFRIERNRHTPETLSYVQKAVVIQPKDDLLVDFIRDPLLQN